MGEAYKVQIIFGIIVPIILLAIAAIPILQLTQGKMKLRGGSYVTRKNTPISYWILMILFSITALGLPILALAFFAQFVGHPLPGFPEIVIGPRDHAVPLRAS